MIDTIHDDIGPTGQVNGLRCQHTFEWYRNRNVGVLPRCLQFTDPLLNGLHFAGGTIENGVEDFHKEDVLILMSDNGIVTVQKVLTCCLNSGLQCRNNLCVFRLTIGDCLILKDDEEASCDGLTGTDRLD